MMNKGCRILSLLVATVLLVLRPVAGQSKGFLNIQGIRGEATDKDHKGWIEVLSADLGANNRLLKGGTTTRSSSSGRGAINIVKSVDASSAVLQKMAMSGRSLGLVELNFTTTDSEGNKSYLQLTMTDVVVTSFSPSGSGGDDKPTETVTLSYSKVKWEYKPLDKDDRSA
jgi:type VI secretion system secreted protein Hcp